MKNSILRLTTVMVIWLGMCCGNAFGYSSIVAFGDSLTDNGTFTNYRATNGKLWVELLADHYSATLYDYAFYGATTGYDDPAIGSPVNGLLWQVNAFSPLLGSLPAGNTLLTVWAGANDFLQKRDPGAAVNNIGTALADLYLAGGRNFLVPNLPDIGKTPAYLYSPSSFPPYASLWTGTFDADLDAMLKQFKGLHTDINLYSLDAFNVFNQFAVGSPEWLSFFWVDGFHPSDVGHELIYQSALEAVPEPGTMTLFAAGVLGITGIMRRRPAKLG